MNKLDFVGPPQPDPCPCCGGDARHRVFDAVRERVAQGENERDVADDLRMHPEDVRAIASFEDEFLGLSSDPAEPL